MHSNNPDTEIKNRMPAQKTTTLAILRCFWSIILGGIVILLSAWIFWDYITTPQGFTVTDDFNSVESKKYKFVDIDDVTIKTGTSPSSNFEKQRYF